MPQRYNLSGASLTFAASLEHHKAPSRPTRHELRLDDEMLKAINQANLRLELKEVRAGMVGGSGIERDGSLP